jgi:hypothetical protein
MKRHRFAAPGRLGIADNIEIDGTRNVGDARLEIEILPTKFEEFSSAYSCARVEEDHGALALRKLLQECLQLFWREKFRIANPRITLEFYQQAVTDEKREAQELALKGFLGPTFSSAPKSTQTECRKKRS